MGPHWPRPRWAVQKVSHRDSASARTCGGYDDAVARRPHDRLRPSRSPGCLFQVKRGFSEPAGCSRITIFRKGEVANDDRSASANSGCLVLGTGAQPGHDAVNNRERGPAASAAAAARSALAQAMGLGSPASLLVGTTRPPVPLVVAARTRDSNLQQPT